MTKQKWTYEKAIRLFLECKDELDEISKETSQKRAKVNEKMNALEAWITTHADDDGLKNVKTDEGTVYWSQISKCSVSSPEEFRNYVIATQRWDLMETRASKSAVKAMLEETSDLPPGVNFNTMRNFVVKRPTTKEA